jgi:hypothetical protein
MIALALLLTACTLQDPAPTTTQLDQWWQQLSQEDRERLHRRWHEFKSLAPENQEGLKKRFETIEQERSLLWRRLADEQRRSVEGLEEPMRRRWLDERVRERILERGQELERRDPGMTERFRGLPPGERMHRGAQIFLQVNVDRARAELEKAVQEGWIGPAAAGWLRQAPPEELLTAIGQVQRWRFLQKAEQEGFWQRHQIPPEVRMHLLELPTPYFFEEIRRLERGEEPLGPPHDWRGGGPPGRRGHDR